MENAAAKAAARTLEVRKPMNRDDIEGERRETAAVLLDLTKGEVERLVEAVHLASSLQGERTEGRFRALEDKVYSAVSNVWWQDVVMYVDPVEKNVPSKRVYETCEAIIRDYKEARRLEMPRKPRAQRSKGRKDG